MGETIVTWTATDAAGNTATATQKVTITDTTAPVITLPVNVTTEATGSQTSVVIGTATATDLVDGSVIVTNNAPASFSVGETIVTWTSTDDAGNSATATQKVTITDTTAPAITLPSDVTTEATGSQTSVVIGTATATDLVDGSVIVTNNAPATFPVGETIVTWTSTDAAGNSATATQSVTITDTTAPAITVPVDITTEATGSQTSVSIGTATATDLVDGLVSVTNNASGTFPVGETIVTWTSTDAAGNSATDTQSITITDTTAVNQPPVINYVVLNTSSPNTGGDVLVTVNATDDVAVITVEANGVLLTHQSGNIWNGTIIALEGTHVVNISAVDLEGSIVWNNSTIYNAATSKNQMYDISFLPPIKTTDIFDLKNGRSLPIKFTARDNETGEFIYDDTVNVTITNSTGHLITYFTNGTGTDSVRINIEDEQYIVNFHSKNYELNEGETYAVTVTFGGKDSLTGYDMTHFTLLEGGKVKGKAKV